MTEISTMLLIFLIEGLVASVIILLVWSVLVYRRKKKDREAVNKLVSQIKHQSKTRLEITSSFLQEKYRFEGSGLKKAVAVIDKGEKKFMQNLINTYLNRDAHAIAAMDASMAELIEVYKELTPIMPEIEAEEPSAPEGSEEVRLLRLSNASLVEELNASRQSMADMLEEFGNMFGGGKNHEMKRDEVMDKLNKYKTEHESSERFSDAQEVEVQLDEGVTDTSHDEAQQEKIEEKKQAAPLKTSISEILENNQKVEQAQSEDVLDPEKSTETVEKKGAATAKKQPVKEHIDIDDIEIDEVDDVIDQNEIDDLLSSIDLSEVDKK